jgi:hypothetical protein
MWIKKFDHCKARCTDMFMELFWVLLVVSVSGNYSSIGVVALGQQENVKKKHWQLHYETSCTCFCYGDGELSYVAPFSFKLAFHTWIGLAVMVIHLLGLAEEGFLWRLFMLTDHMVRTQFLLAESIPINIIIISYFTWISCEYNRSCKCFRLIESSHAFKGNFFIMI